MMESFDINQAVNLVSWVFIALGSFFVLVGALGLLRMPDMFTRMHAASVTDTVGAGFLILGMIGQAGLTLVTVKLLFILGLLLLTSPVAAHALAQAALHDGLEPLLSDDRRERSLAEKHADSSEPGLSADEALDTGKTNNGAAPPGGTS